jgi:NAD(P)-dependent dehydrogenase (short-subunit alcohol dehydrogenase family)
MSYVVADVSTEDGTAAYVAEAVRRYGGVDVLFSNAGVPGPIKMLSEHTTAEFDEVLAINLRGVWLSVKHTLPELTRRGGGSVLLTSSIAGLAGFAAFSAYVATKHAVVGLARAFAAECAPAGVRVNAICPGFIHNDMLRTLFDKFAPLAGVAEDDLQSALNDRVPAKQFGTDHDVAKLALWLASDDSAYVNGTHQVLDGGVLATIM